MHNPMTIPEKISSRDPVFFLRITNGSDYVDYYYWCGDVIIGDYRPNVRVKSFIVMFRRFFRKVPWNIGLVG